ncbi:TIR protein [Oceanococcus atlanticus]|uniref:TIR protein n=1 Tax=Oceanococcus atlanticus TaxID=1317117 RepID=A0A1Y1SAG3_9GAMM|nr:toll/interleukin-1 receptor domain-containing protein [Oceanococcus atlanticus]ORE84864.1 TIR protein [Oceanococcus atlanticus]
MATVREYFDKVLGHCLSLQNTLLAKSQRGEDIASLIAKIVLDLEGNAKYWSFYIPACSSPFEAVAGLFAVNEVQNCSFGPQSDGLVVETGFADYPERASSVDLVFTRRVLLYFEDILDQRCRDEIKSLGRERGLFVIIRDAEYAEAKSRIEKPLAFISHDSRDKDDLARPLAVELSKKMCPVWYDEYSLRVGASLRQSIESGLKETRHCIVILSPNFFSNDGWGRAEFDSVYTREIIERENVILPIWHGVTVKQVYEYSPRLADKFGLSSELGVEELARRLEREIRSGDT